MLKSAKLLKMTALLGAAGLVLGGCHGAKTNHLNPHFQQKAHYATPFSKVKRAQNQINPAANSVYGRYGPVHNAQYGPQYGAKTHHQKRPKKYKNFVSRLRGEKTPYYQVAAPTPGPYDQFQRWVDYEPEYRLYPGDQLDVVVQSAPELSRTLTVGPDGRVLMPMLEPIMAAGRTITDVNTALRTGLGQQLRDPRVAVTPRAYSPQQIFVGGQVQQSGTYTLPGPIGAIEAVFMAGGFSAGARTTKVAVLRRAPNGAMMIRPIDIQGGIRNIREYNDNIQLRRGDIIFVPKTNLAEVGAFTQAIRQTIPVDFNISYTIGNIGGGDGATALAPIITP